MIVRLTKILLLAGCAFHLSLVLFNNVVDHQTNLEYVQHVASMDSVWPHNRGGWRAMTDPLAQHGLYLIIMAWQALAASAMWLGCLRCWQARGADAATFGRNKQWGAAGLSLAMLLWLVPFLTVGGEWFMMWQSHAWNGQGTATSLFTVEGLALLYFAQSEPDL